MSLSLIDPEVAAAIAAEAARQRDDLELIASENYVSPDVLEAVGSVLTNKYAEGLPGKRYYGGCQHVDVVENIARERAKRLFGCHGVNVQPHSGAQANMAVCLAALKPGDTLLGLALSHGGHLSHGMGKNVSGLLYRAMQYTLGADDRIDLNQVREIAQRERPRLIITGGSAYPRTWDFEAFRKIADEVGALLLADIAHVAGLVVVGLHPNPVPHCHYVTTTTHKTLRGPRGGMAMADKDHIVGLNSAVFPGSQGGPLMHVIAAKAICFGEALDPSFLVYQRQVLDNAQAMAARLQERGFKLVSGGTDNHLMLVDLSNHPLSGQDAEELLGRVGITVNKNTVPNEKRSPFVTSGIRIGTPAMTTRGCTAEDASRIADWIADVLQFSDDASRLEVVRQQVRQLMRERPIPGQLPHDDEVDDYTSDAHGAGAGR